MLTNKIAVITGGAKGIGGASSRVFLKENARVAILDLDEAAAEAIVKDSHDRAMFIRCDVSKEAEVKAAMAQVIDTWGEIDVLVSNAGIQRYSTVTETTEEEWDLVMNVNLKSAFLCAKHAIPSMQRKGAGIVINVSSVQAFISQPKVAPYTTSKTGMLALTRSIAVDYAPHIRSVAVCPGTIDTPMLRDALALSPNPQAVYQECVDMHLVKRIGKVEEVGELIAFLASDKATFFNGQALRIDGGLGVMIGGSKQD